VAQFRAFVNAIPMLWMNITGQISAASRRFPQLEGAIDAGEIIRQLFMGAETWTGIAQNVFAGTVGALTAALLITVTVFYTLMDPWPLLYGLRGLFPDEWAGTIDRITRAVAERIRRWVIGTVALAVMIGTLDYVGLFLINLLFEPDIPFIFFFAILGGLLEVVPIIGPIIASVLPALVGFSIHPVLGLLVLGVFFLIQQLENTLIAPLVMHRAVHLHPVSLLFALFVLTGIFGLFGAIIAVPVASVFKVLYDEWYYPLLHHGNAPTPPPREKVDTSS
jgi:predicted PurR-regulated permease PerM